MTRFPHACFGRVPAGVLVHVDAHLVSRVVDVVVLVHFAHTGVARLDFRVVRALISTHLVQPAACVACSALGVVVVFAAIVRDVT